MYRWHWSYSRIVHLGIWPVLAFAQWENGNSDALFSFVTRPDLKPPKWNITTHHEHLVSPGYWFVGPYRSPRNKADPTDSWMGPHIYDGNGELVWSGTNVFANGKNTMSFQVHNVRGEDMMTALDWDLAEGVILDSHYEIQDSVKIEENGPVNAHEFHFVDDGAHALVMKTEHKVSTKEDAETVGFSGLCHAAWDGFQELDTETWKPTFTWNPFGHIWLNESTQTDNAVEQRCDAGHGGWDFIHANSVDKNQDGDYIFSSRHTDTIYKVSRKDGSIIWRLGGLQSDFEMNGLKFSRQHNIRFRGHNGTHAMVSMLDNAVGRDSQPATHEYSRGLLIALDEKTMVATCMAEYKHPDRSYAPKRGSYQQLPNANVFMGWSTNALQSEHTGDGTIVMEARLLATWLGSYRNYKFPFVGRPLSLPTVHSAAYGNEDNDLVDTTVHVSWNGATEVAKWNFYKSTHDGGYREFIGWRGKVGFETKLEHGGYASYVVVEGVNRNGEILGTSNVFKTIPHPTITAPAVEKERLWLLNADKHTTEDSGIAAGTHSNLNAHLPTDINAGGANSDKRPAHHATSSGLIRSILSSRIAACTVGFVSCATVVVVIWMAKRQKVFERLWTGQYARLDGFDLEATEDQNQVRGEEEKEHDEAGRPESRASGDLLRPQRRTMFLRSVS